MNQEIRELFEKAELARSLYRQGMINREEATKEIMPYIEACNIAATRIAKRYKQKPKLVSLHAFLR